MNKYSVNAKKDDSIKYWVFDSFKFNEYICEKEPDDVDFENKKNYRNMEEVGSILYAVRRSYNKIVEQKMLHIPYENKNMDNLYYPIESNAVELSDFFHKATLLSVYAKTFINVDKDGKYSFKLRNSCHFKIWVNGKENGIYRPKTRNVENEFTIELPLTKGDNEVLVYMEDLAERDVYFYFELTYIDKEPISYFIPIYGKQEEIDYKTSILKSLYTKEDTYNSCNIEVFYDSSLLNGDTEIYFNTEDTKLNGYVGKGQKIILTPNKNSFNLTLDGNGSKRRIFTAYSDKTEIKQSLLVSVFEKSIYNIVPEKTIQGRKKQIIELTSKGKDGKVNTAISQIEEYGEITPYAREIIEDAFKHIVEKKDCSDFRMLPILVIYQRYYDLLDEKLKKTIEELALNFRYWFDEPGNDVMWFYSENHALLFHGCQYLAGYLFKDKVFKVSGLTGIEQMKKGEEKLHKWLDNFLCNGYDEWNSVTYLPIDLIGLFSLYIAVIDMSLKQKITKALDETFEIIAANMFKNKYSCSYARVYEEAMKAPEINEVNQISWIAWGQGIVNGETNCCPLMCISDYEPLRCGLLLNAEGSGNITVQKKNGYYGAHTYVYKTENYCLASAINMDAFMPGMQQHVLNLSMGNDAVTIGINHPGEKAFSGQRRPSYWAGNGTLPYVFQSENVVLSVYNINENHIVDFIHVYIPLYKIDKYKIEGDWFFAQKDDAYVGIWFSNGCKVTSCGPNVNRELISYGRNQGLAIICGDKNSFDSFDKFVNSYISCDIKYDGKKTINFNDKIKGKFEIDCSETYTLNGIKMPVNIVQRCLININRE